jgi:hypothetical protein
VQHFWTEWYARERLATRLRESEAAEIIVEVTREDRDAQRPGRSRSRYGSGVRPTPRRWIASHVWLSARHPGCEPGR